MPKNFLSFISIQILMLYLVSATSRSVKAEVSVKSTTLIPTLKQTYPFLINQELTNNIKSLLRNIRRRRRHRRKRKDHLVFSDSEGNPALVVRKARKVQENPRYFYQPETYGLQNLALPPSVPLGESMPSRVVPLVMIPVQPILPYNFKLVQRALPYPSVVLPQPINVVAPQPYLQEKKGYETRDSKPNQNGFNNFEIIKLRDISGSLENKRKSKRSHTLTTTSTIATTMTSPEEEHSNYKREESTCVSTTTQEVSTSKKDDNVESEHLNELTNSMSSILSALEGMFPNSKKSTTTSSTKPQEISTSVVQTTQSLSPSTSITASTCTSSTTTTSPFTIPTTATTIRAKIPPLATFERPQSYINEESLPVQQAPKLSLPQLLIPSDSVIEPPLQQTKVRNSFDENERDDDLWKNEQSLMDCSLNTSYHYHPTPIIPCKEPAPQSDNSSKMIEQILEDVEAIRIQEQKVINKEDFPCNLTGSWSSSAGGVLLNITNHNGTAFQVNLTAKTPPSKKGFLIDRQWNISGFNPFPKTGLVILTGINTKAKQVLTFVGECRSCGGGEIVTGNWLHGRVSRDCRDQRASQELLSDIWRKETLTDLRIERLKMIEERNAANKKVKKKNG